MLCVGLNRGLLGDPFVRSGSPISAEKIERMTAPIGWVLAQALAQRARD